MVFFPHSMVDVYRQVTDEELCGVDNYGKPLTCEVFLGSTIADFQEYNQGDARREFGEQVNGAARLYLPHECELEIDNTCKVVVQGEDRKWLVYGQPIIRNALIPHIKVNLILETIQLTQEEIDEIRIRLGLE